eukprot:gnl/MRDRNA2_/MRDRNA2_17527_c0_seq1.p1 gnl/MRDRNA2_/MRDRNA2_17527_c0~~gnl/MRDRNA2_/MRDRNA2_17527_c0_seq1.p1  ORF type:complete len:103 (-),score=6.89 gnl/MRDRNA2_/MRDRNA2_17527_c0_seq1:59-367(-)
MDAEAMLLVIDILPCIRCAIWPHIMSSSMDQIILPLTIELTAIVANKRSAAMNEIGTPISRVHRSIRPVVNTKAIDVPLAILAFIPRFLTMTVVPPRASMTM